MSHTEDQLGPLRDEVRDMRLTLIARQLSLEQQAALKYKQQQQQRTASAPDTAPRRDAASAAAAAIDAAVKQKQRDSAGSDASPRQTPRRSMSSVSELELSSRQFDLRSGFDSTTEESADAAEMEEAFENSGLPSSAANVNNSAAAAQAPHRPEAVEVDLMSFADDDVDEFSMPPPSAKQAQGVRTPAQQRSAVATPPRGFEDDFSSVLSLDLREDNRPPAEKTKQQTSHQDPALHLIRTTPNVIPASSNDVTTRNGAPLHATRNSAALNDSHNVAPSLTRPGLNTSRTTAPDDRSSRQPVENSSNDPFRPIADVQRKMVMEKTNKKVRQQQPPTAAAPPLHQQLPNQPIKQTKIPQQHDVKATSSSSAAASPLARHRDVTIPQPQVSPRSPMPTQRRTRAAAAASGAVPQRQPAFHRKTTPDRPIELDGDD